jgi:hypothetical protein
MMPLYEQPMLKLLGSLSPTIQWLSECGPVDAANVPTMHLESIKQLERIGIVHKRNNRSYELQRIRLKKLMDSLGIEELAVPLAEVQSVSIPASIPEV